MGATADSVLVVGIPRGNETAVTKGVGRIWGEEDASRFSASDEGVGETTRRTYEDDVRRVALRLTLQGADWGGEEDVEREVFMTAPNSAGFGVPAGKSTDVEDAVTI